LANVLNYVGVDWSTVTTKEPTRYAEWKEAFVACAAQEQAAGYKWAKGAILGYKGEQAGRVFLGERSDGAMLRISGSAADKYFWLFSPDGAHTTRIDLCANVVMDLPKTDMLSKMYVKALATPNREGRPTKLSLLVNSDGGSTLYVGSRSSARYGRIYDKGVEEGTHAPGLIYRFELEIKDVMADQAVRLMAQSSAQDRTMLSLIHNFFTERGIPVPWRQPAGEGRLNLPYVPQNDVGSVKWLQGPVASTVARLVGTIGTEATLRALFAKACNENTDSDIISSMASLYESQRWLSVS